VDIATLSSKSAKYESFNMDKTGAVRVYKINPSPKYIGVACGSISLLGNKKRKN